MAVKIEGEGSLAWEASIDLSTFKKSADEMSKTLMEVARAASREVQIQNAAMIASVQKSISSSKEIAKVSDFYEGYNKTKEAVKSLTEELAKLKAPDFANGKSAKEIETLNKYILQQQGLLEDLTILAADYEKKLYNLSTNQIQVPDIAIAPIPTQNISEIIGTGVINELKSAFGDIDGTTQKFIQDLIDLEIKLQNIRIAENDVAEAFNAGKITQEEYAQASSFLVAGIKEIDDKTIELTNNQKKYEESLRANSGSIEEKKNQLASLKVSYDALSEAQRNSPEGENLRKGIASLKAEIKGLNPERIEQTKTSVESVRTQLTKLQQLMSQNPNSPLFNEWKKQAGQLKESLTAVKTEIDQATNNTAGVEAFASGLRGLIGGFTAATGVIGIFSNDTAAVEEVTKNAASALALLNGVQEVSNVLSKTGALNVYLLGLMRSKNAAATSIETLATEANVIATEANIVATGTQTAATEAATVASKGFAAAMLANPAGLILAGITALAIAYLALKDNSDKAAQSAKDLNEIQKKGKENAAEELSKLKLLYEATQDQNLAMSERKRAVDALQELYPDYFKNINDEIILNGQAADSYDRLFAAILKNGMADAAKEKIKEISKGMLDDIEVVNKVNKQIELINKNGAAVQGKPQYVKSPSGSYVNTQPIVISTNAADIEKEINALLNKNKKPFDAVNSANARIKAIVDSVGASNLIDSVIGNDGKSKTGDLNKGLSETNSLLQEQKGLLESLNILKRDALQSGLTKEASELDKINEKYDKLGTKIQEFNQKAPANLRIDIAQLNDSRAIELQNAQYRQNASNYAASLDTQKQSYENYEEAKLQIGEANAQKLYNIQIQNGSSYIEYLQKQKAEIEKSVPVGPNQELNLQQRLQVAAIDKEIAKTTIENTAKATQAQLDQIKQVLEATITYNEQRKAIEAKYVSDVEALKKVSTGEDYKVKLQILTNAKNEELKAVDDAAIQESSIYKKLNDDIYGYTRDRIKKEIEEAKKIIATGKTTDVQGNVISIPPEVLRQIEEYIKKLEEAGQKQKTLFGLTSTQLFKIGADAKSIGSSLNDLSNSIRPFNEGLANALETMGSLSNIAGDTVSTFAKFTSGDIVGGITGAIGVISSIFSMGAKQRAAQLKAQQELAQFQTNILNGELEINALYRDRERQNILNNKIRLDGIRDEIALLNQQKSSNLDDYNRIFNMLQQQSYVSSLGGGSNAGYSFLGITDTRQQLASLSGKSYADLERLFNSGQLSDSAKALFEQLQKIKQEGVDIDAAIEKNRLAAQQIFTGTTSDNILDSIIQGFADGKRATADFADNFEELMKQSVLNALKYQALEKPLKDFYENFAAAAQSDGILTSAEIAQLQAQYNATITAAGQQFDQLSQIANLNFNNNNAGNGNSLQGAIKGITQQQADLLAGQFGGLRINAFEQLQVARSSLNILNQIANNTSLLVSVDATLKYFKTTGIRVI